MDENGQHPTEFTDIAGFYNGNSFPIQIVVSEPSINITLPPKAFFEGLDARGRKIKINDPRLMAYTGKNRLSCEKVPGKQFPVYRVGNRNTQGRYPIFLSTQEKITSQDAVGNPVPLTPNLAQQRAEMNPAPRSPIRAWSSVTEAVRAGVASRPRERIVNAPKETDGAPIPGHAIPEMVYEDADVASKSPISKDLTMPAVKLNAESGAATPIAVPPLAVKPVEVPPMSGPTFEQLLQNEQTVQPIPEVVPSSVPQEPQEETSQVKYVCSVCQQADFPFRSVLDRHAKTKHPERYDEIMAAYPRKPQASS